MQYLALTPARGTVSGPLWNPLWLEKELQNSAFRFEIQVIQIYFKKKQISRIISDTNSFQIKIPLTLFSRLSRDSLATLLRLSRDPLLTLFQLSHDSLVTLSQLSRDSLASLS